MRLFDQKPISPESNEIEDWEFTRQAGCKTYLSNIKHMSCECLEHYSAHNSCESYVDFKDLRSLPRCESRFSIFVTKYKFICSDSAKQIVSGYLELK